MEPELLRQMDLILSRCGRRRSLPDGLSVVPLERDILLPMVLQPNTSRTFVKEVTGDTRWSLRAISTDQRGNQLTGVRALIQLPTGRFLIGRNGQDVGQLAGVGSWRYAVDPEVECDPGSKFQVTLTDVGGLAEAFACNLLFQGTLDYYLKGGEPVSPPPLVSTQPRYAGIVNENILAPCFLAGHGPVTPAGYEDEAFTYSSDVATLTIGGTVFTTLTVPIDNGLDFQMRRILVDLQAEETATAGAILGRLRAGSGYALSDDYIDLARYLAGAEYPHDWKVRGSDAVYIDLQLVDTAGTGSFVCQIHLEGVRRRKL